MGWHLLRFISVRLPTRRVRLSPLVHFHISPRRRPCGPGSSTRPWLSAHRSRPGSHISSRYPGYPLHLQESSFTATAPSPSLSARRSIAADWPQWRGPHRDGISKETGLLKEWPKDGPEAALAGRPTSATGTRRRRRRRRPHLPDWATRAWTTSTSWPWTSRTASALGDPARQGRPEPAAALPGRPLHPDRGRRPRLRPRLRRRPRLRGRRRRQGAVAKNLRTDFGGKPGSWAYSESPLVDGDVLVVHARRDRGDAGGAEQEDGRAGLEVRPCRAATRPATPRRSWSRRPARRQYVQFLGKGVVGVDAKTGKFLWRYDETGKGAGQHPDAGGRRRVRLHRRLPASGGGLVKITSAGGEVKAEKVYFERDTPFTPRRAGAGRTSHCTGPTPTPWCASSSRPGKIEVGGEGGRPGVGPVRRRPAVRSTRRTDRGGGPRPRRRRRSSRRRAGSYRRAGRSR